MKGWWDNKVYEVHEQSRLLLIASFKEDISFPCAYMESCLPLASESSVMLSPQGELRELENDTTTLTSWKLVVSKFKGGS